MAEKAIGMVDEQRTRVAVIIGSTRTGRFGTTVAGWFAEVARQRADLDVDVVDLVETNLPEVSPGDGPAPAAVRDLARRLGRADAVVVVTPEFNHSFPASLKTAIDWFYDEWMAKPVGFVSYGSPTKPEPGSGNEQSRHHEERSASCPSN